MLFKKGLEGILDETIRLSTASLKLLLVRGYTPNVNTHQHVSDITGGGGGTIVATSPALGSKTFTDGALDAADTAFTAVAAGDPCQHLVLIQSSAAGGGADVAAGSQRLIAYVTATGGLPVTPNGEDINVSVEGLFTIS